MRRRGFTIWELAVVLGALAFLIALFVPGPQQHGFLDLVYKDESGKQTKYVLFVPWDYRGEKPYPVIFFLNGAGDAYRVTRVGLGMAIRNKEKSFPFIAIFPRINGLWDQDNEHTRRGIKILDEVARSYTIDRQRIYLTGLSNGGTATWFQAATYPDLWAAIVPVAGRARLDLVKQIKHIPCWCFHGDADQVAAADEARAMIDALKKAGGRPRYTELAEYGHNVWDKAYNNPRLYEWLLDQTLPTSR